MSLASPTPASDAPARIAYVVNAWWPKLDGAAIAAMGHCAHFAAQGHPVLVVRPGFPAGGPIMSSPAARQPDPLPARELLQFVDFRMFGDRAGGWEPEMDPTAFAAVESALEAFAPDVLIIADPDMFGFDAFRLPGFNSLVHRPRSDGRAAPVTIASFTFFTVEAVTKMPDFWWLSWLDRHTGLFSEGIGFVYGHFDHIFLNGDHSLSSLQTLTCRDSLLGPSRTVASSASVVASRGVAHDFCALKRDDECAAFAAKHRLPTDGAGADAGAGLTLLYVGRLSYDKSVRQSARHALTPRGRGGRGAKRAAPHARVHRPGITTAHTRGCALLCRACVAPSGARAPRCVWRGYPRGRRYRHAAARGHRRATAPLRSAPAHPKTRMTNLSLMLESRESE